MSLLLGVDLGTSSLKVMLVSEDGSQETIVSQHYSFSSPKNGYAEQNPEEWWEASCIAIQKILSKTNVSSKRIKALSFSGQMHGLVTLDKNKEIVRPAILHCDSRSGKQVNLLKKSISKQDHLNILRNPFYPGFLLPSLLWLKENEPEKFQLIQHVMLPKDFLIFKMTGLFATDFSDASGTLAFDIPKTKWSDTILNQFNIPLEWFPQCYEIGTPLGKINSKVARKLGLSTETTIVMGGGDQIMQGIGNGIIDIGQASVNIGTSGQVSFQSDQPIQNPNFNTNLFCGYRKEQWVSAGAIMNAGLSYNWLQKVLGITDLKGMDDLVANVPVGSGGLIFLPYLTGERTPHLNSNISGIFAGLNINTGRAEMTRSVFEGVVFALKDSLELCKSLGLKTDHLTASGGGSNSKIWLEIQSDILNLPLKLTESKEEACLGAVISAAVGVDIYQDFTEACSKLVQTTDLVIEPNPKHNLIYEEYYIHYKEFYKNVEKTLEQITLLGRETNVLEEI